MTVARVDTIRSLAYTSISGAYAAVGSALTHAWRMFKITNNTNGDMMFSFDGSTDNIFVPASSFTLYDISTNVPPVSDLDELIIGLGTIFYVKQVSVPTSGTVYIEGIYARGE